MAVNTETREHVDVSLARRRPADRVAGWYQISAKSESGPESRPIPAVGDPAACHRLTRRELQVLQLVASSCTDREIGDHLCIGARTAEWHLANAFNKLGLSTRAAAAAYAVRQGLA